MTDLYLQVLESMPMIPIHVAEIKKLIVKDQISGEENLNEDHLLNVLNSNSCGKNPTFFKAFGHNEVFGLKNAIPDGGTVVEIVEKVPVECDNWTANDGVQFRQDGVLYVHLPDGHPVITGSLPSERLTAPVVLPGPSSTISLPEVTEADGPDPSSEVVTEAPKVTEVEPIRKTMNTRNKNSDNKISYAEIDEDDTTSKKHRHNLRPQKPNRHIHALKQQAKRRQKNKNVAAGVPLPQRTMSRRSTVTSNGEIEIAFKPTSDELDKNPQTMKELLTSIPGFNLRKLQLKGQNKKFTNAQMIQQTKEGSINLDTPDSILTKVNLRTLLNKSTFSRLPPLYQFKLMQLLPQVDLLFDDNKGLRLNSSAFNNEFFAKACHEWRERLYKGDFTAEVLQKNRSDLEKDKQRLDPWKLKHYEPLWGMKRRYDASTNTVTIVAADTKPLEVARTRRSAATAERESEHETGKRKSERRKVNSDKVEPEVMSAVIEEAPPIFEESVIEVSQTEVVCESSTPEEAEEPDVADGITEEEIFTECPQSPSGASTKSPRVTISQLSEEIHDIYEPATKKRRTEELSESSLPDPSIIKSFNDPILELDSKYDLSPEETCPENFMESMDEANENENIFPMDDVKEEDDCKPDIFETLNIVQTKTEIEETNSEPKTENPICDERAVDTITEAAEEENYDYKAEAEAMEAESPGLPSETEAVISKVESEDEAEDEDSQQAPSLSSVEPISSIDSNVLSVEMAPPTLSPNYGSPSHEDLSEEEPMETAKADDEDDEEPQPVEEVETPVEQAEVGPKSLSCASSDISQDLEREVDLDDPQAPSGGAAVPAMTTIQLPTVPLSLHDTKLFTSSIKSPPPSQAASPEVEEAVENVRTISPKKETAVCMSVIVRISVNLFVFQVKPPSPTQNKMRTPAGTVNLQRSYEICRAVVEKSVNRAKVEAQLVPPPAKQRKMSATLVDPQTKLPVSLPPGATIVVASSQQSKSFLAPRACQPIAVRAVRPAARLRLPGPVQPNQQVLIQRAVGVVSGVTGLSQQAIVVRNNNPFSLPAPSPPVSASVSCPPLSCMLTPSVTTGTASSPPGLNVAQFVSTTNNSFLSNSLNISNISSPAAPSSFPLSPARLPSAQQQLIIRYHAVTPGQAQTAGNKHFLIQQLPQLPDKPCLQETQILTPQILTRAPVPVQAVIRTPTPPPLSPKSPKSVTPQMMIQQITRPCTPPPQLASPLSVRQQVVLRTAKQIPRLVIPPQTAPNNSQIVLKALQEDEKFTKPLPPIQTTPVKTVMKTTLLPRSPVSDDQIASILQQMMPEPAAQCRISPEEKEKASAVAAMAANTFEEAKLLSPPQKSPLMSPGGVVQPLELPENGSEGPGQEDSSLDNVTIPELAEELNNIEREKEPAVPMSNSRLILKVRLCTLPTLDPLQSFLFLLHVLPSNIKYVSSISALRAPLPHTSL